MSRREPDSPSVEDATLSWTLTKLVVLAVTLGIVYWLRPLFHGIIYRMVYSPGAAIALGIPTLIAILLYLAPPLRSTEHGGSASTKATMVGVVFIIFIVLATLVGFAGGLYEEEHLATTTMDRAEQVEEFPEANADNPRIVPRAVADVQTRGSVSYRTHELGTSDIARMEDGRLAWSYAIQPDQFQNRWSGHQRGVLVSDMTSMEDREMRAYDQHEFKYGQGHVMHRSTGWHVKKSGGYWSQYNDDPVEFVHDNESYMAFPKTGHEWHWAGPIPYTVPVWDGVALVHQDGTIEHLSPEEAQQSEILDGQRIYPLYNAKRNAKSLGYRNGIVNQMPLVGSYDGVVEPASLPSGAGNEQPFVIDLEGEQMSYVMAMEPTGDTSRGLDEVWFFDASTGEPRYYGTGSETLLGPERATGIVRSEDSQTNWDSGGDTSSAGQFRVVEPIPVTIDNELWWHTKVVPTDNTDVSRNVFVSAHSGEAVELQDTEGIIDFMDGENASEIDSAQEVGESGETTTEPAPDNESVGFYIVVKDSDGNVVERIPVEEGHDISIEARENETDG